MGVTTQILDGLGLGTKARVTEENALLVSQAVPLLPDVGDENRLRFFSSLLGSTGADLGTTSMNVDGSSTAQEFFIDSNSDYDIRVREFLIYIEDTAEAQNDKFGALSALSTGWDLVANESGVDTFLISKAKTSGEIITKTNTPIFGIANDKWNSVALVDGTNYAGFYTYDVAALIPGGIRIGRQSGDRVVSVVNDSLTGLTDFTVRALGYRHYPKE